MTWTDVCFESLGFRVRPSAHIFDRDGYLVGADAVRAADLNAMFADDSIRCSGFEAAGSMLRHTNSWTWAASSPSAAASPPLAPPNAASARGRSSRAERPEPL